jgi:predicted small integral membrane protein
MIQYLKIILVALIALWGLIGGLNNLADFDPGSPPVARVLSMEDTFSGGNMWRATSNSVLIFIGFASIFIPKLACAALCGIGAWQMWQSRNGSAEVFNQSKKYAILGAGIALVMLFGGFIVVANEFFLMWQYEFGQRVSQQAFRLFGSIGLILLFVQSPDQKTA